MLSQYSNPDYRLGGSTDQGLQEIAWRLKFGSPEPEPKTVILFLPELPNTSIAELEGEPIIELGGNPVRELPGDPKPYELSYTGIAELGGEHIVELDGNPVDMCQW